MLHAGQRNLKAIQQSDDQIPRWYIYYDVIRPVEVARIHLRFEDGISEEEQRESGENWGSRVSICWRLARQAIVKFLERTSSMRRLRELEMMAGMRKTRAERMAER
jgi:hypothetical protein